MLKKKILPVATEVITDVICDMCGESCRTGINPDEYEFSILKANWGYTSHKDMENWEAHFCESCSDKIKTFVNINGGKIN